MEPLVVLLVLVALVAVIEETVRWLRTRTRYRRCPRCGRDVEVGVLECANCGFDFRAIGSGQSPTNH